MTKDITKIDWSAKDRDKYITKLRNDEFDLIIIGGGITGSGIFRDACIRNKVANKNLKIGLLEKCDFAFGTSNKSTKMVHGGIRYLAYGEFDLVHESETERDWLRNDFQNLIRPVPFLYPAYKGHETKSTIKMGLSIYDKLADKNNYKDYEWVDHEELEKTEPEFDTSTTRGKGAGRYFDTNVNDARLTLESIKEGIYYGGIAINYIKAESLIKNNEGKITGVNVSDELSGETFGIKAKKVVNATGVWTDTLLEGSEDIIRPTKGVHIVVPYENVKCSNAIIVRSIDDARHFFCVPREKEFILIGTTDTDYDGSYDEVYCSQEDSDYMTRSVKHYFPKANLDNDQIISAYAGLRPLIKGSKEGEEKSESAVSRKHEIIESDNGLTSMAGGKLTTYRLMAEELIKKIIENGDIDLPFKEELTKKKFLISYDLSEWKNDKSKFDSDEDILEHLYQEYGKGINEIFEIIKKEPELKKRIVKHRFFILAEIKYIIQHEFAPRLVDVLYRRTEVWMLIHPKYQQEVAKRAAEIMGEYYDWSEERIKREIEDYLNLIYKNDFFYKK
ncbi:MAG: glycerol-3-phosphate dehydrogenase/oxidase [Promethearchaeota archaeon]|nr:MAG: glycerol-3-phosphate dehydrogenase/oxidase [Candidatus Lokiarchaeota archaeon]